MCSPYVMCANLAQGAKKLRNQSAMKKKMRGNEVVKCGWGLQGNRADCCINTNTVTVDKDEYVLYHGGPLVYVAVNKLS